MTTVKVVYNARYGGFGLSEAGVLRYAEIKGLELYPEKRSEFPNWDLSTYWLVPKEQRETSSKFYAENVFHPREISRTDPVLVQVVEELQAQANGRFAQLAIAEVEIGARYRIDEYDGFESVMTVEDYDWQVAEVPAPAQTEPET